jgi:hypothetical protein
VPFFILSDVLNLFGQPGSQYDFNKIGMAQLKDRAQSWSSSSGA